MHRYISIINERTAYALIISMLVSFITLSKDFHYNFDLSLISIAIIFPLVFTIRSAFRRREKALEYLSQFKAGLTTVDHCFQESKKLNYELKLHIRDIIIKINQVMIEYLGSKVSSRDNVEAEIGKVGLFIQANTETIGNGTTLKIFRFMKDVYEGAENIIAVKRHRTPVSIRAYCLVFIYIYPVIYTPALYNKLHDGFSVKESWVVYSLSAISTFILISLYNVQDQMENPFDQKGLDDIRLNDFALNLNNPAPKNDLSNS